MDLIFGAVAFVTTGTAPHLAISSFVLCVGITAFSHSFQLAVNSVFGGWVAFILATAVGQLISWATPLGLWNEGIATGLGIALVIAAFVQNLRIMRWSSTYRNQSRRRLSLEGARA
jgi:hypothetical protein